MMSIERTRSVKGRTAGAAVLGATLLSLALFGPACRRSVPPPPERGAFPLVETTIAEIHAAFRSGELTARRLAEAYLERIEAYDQPTGLNAVTSLNGEALETAAALDREFARTGRLRPLHGIPLIVKDNYDTCDLPTTAGSLALKGVVPPDDAFQVRKLREAGAIVLAKSNMAEWAFSPYLTESSTAGVTRNPYDLDRVPAGSSGGTAAAVAASFVAAGLGTDTGNSIRGPSSHCGLVGIRSTMGLTSRDGIVPLYLRNDIGGPMARTVEDAVRILEVIAGYDPADPITEMSKGKVPPSYLPFLEADGLRGKRIGVFRAFVDAPTADPEIVSLVERAVADMRAAGAEIVDPFSVPDFQALTRNVWCDTFRVDVEAYLATLGGRAPFKSLSSIFESGLYSPYVERRLRRAVEAPPDGAPVCLDLYHEPRNIALREAVAGAMDRHGLDAFVYPTWSNPPRKIGDLESPAGDNSQLIPPHTGLPAFNVPMGFSHGDLPAGLQIVGELFGEPDLIRIAYAYERLTRHRRPPSNFPELRDP
jgi:amidase